MSCFPSIHYLQCHSERSNEKHLGIIPSSSLCADIMQYSSPGNPAVCTSASVSLPYCVDPNGLFNFDRLRHVVGVIVANADRTIDSSDYPTTAVAINARRTRALAIGVQGLADVFMMLQLPYTSPGARSINIAIFETIYYAALDTSCSLAERDGPYPLWSGSPASHGILQMDMWGAEPTTRLDFDNLRSRISRFGLRNSTMTALMPTSSVSKLLGNFESFEPYTRYALRMFLQSTCLLLNAIRHNSNTLILRSSSGDYPLICPLLVRALTAKGLWIPEVQQALVTGIGSVVSLNIPLIWTENFYKGSLQQCSMVSNDLKDVFKTMWELDPKDLIDMAIDRAPFIDHSQSLTLAIRQPTADYLVGHGI